jgi:hypothetical protein
MSIRRFLATAALLSSPTAPTAAPHEVQAPNEPSKLFTQDMSPLGAGWWQIQTNIVHARASRQWDADGDPGDRGLALESLCEVVVNYGATDDLDLGVGVGHAWLSDGASDPDAGRGVTDLVAAAKWRLLGTDGGTSLGVTPTLLIPVGHESSPYTLGPGQGAWVFDARAALTQDWAPGWSTNADVGYAVPFGDREDNRGVFSVNAALGWQPLAWLQPEVELHYCCAYVRHAPNADHAAATAGIVLPLAGWLVPRAGVRQVFAGRDEDRATIFKVSIDWFF